MVNRLGGDYASVIRCHILCAEELPETAGPVRSPGHVSPESNQQLLRFSRPTKFRARGPLLRRQRHNRQAHVQTL
jgi:hypothetical protein